MIGQAVESLAAEGSTSFSKPQRARWSSAVFHKPLGDGRKRDVFPLPFLRVEDMPREDVCRTVARRLMKRRAVITEVNKTVHALNSLFFGGKGPSHSSTVASIDSLSLNQRAALGDIIDSVKKLGPNTACANGSEALEALRAAPSGYDLSGVGVGDVVPLNMEHLSLPDGKLSGVDLLGGT